LIFKTVWPFGTSEPFVGSECGDKEVISQDLKRRPRNTRTVLDTLGFFLSWEDGNTETIQGYQVLEDEGRLLDFHLEDPARLDEAHS
jgi:hypothetical protein